MGWIGFIIALLASTIGSISGIGGGIIMKPVLDALSGYSIATISFLSGCTVLSMATVSVLRQRKSGGTALQAKPALLLSMGGVFGGILGKTVFELLKAQVPDSTVGAVQSAILLLCTLLVLCFMLRLSHIHTHRFEAWYAFGAVGLGLGLLSSFLGIGGGPINIFALMFFFSWDNQKSAVYSLCIIFFSQLSTLVLTLIGGVPSYEPLTLALMCVGGIAGGLIGSGVAKRLSAKLTSRFFIGVLGIVLLTCVYNFVRFLQG